MTKDSIFEDPPRNRYYCYLTKRFLMPGATVLDGGCGIGDKVHALDMSGFNAYGVDFAPEIVKKIKSKWPHLRIECADVRELPFPDAFLDGYWSFGVIEHHYDGYKEILSEMKRVIKKDGYLFLEFPAMNTLRKFIARGGGYDLFVGEKADLGRFYQFALDPNVVKEDVIREGFLLEYKGGLSTRTCLGEEFEVFRKINAFLDKIPLGLGTKAGFLVDMLFGKWLGHSCLLVFKNLY